MCGEFMFRRNEIVGAAWLIAKVLRRFAQFTGDSISRSSRSEHVAKFLSDAPISNNLPGGGRRMLGSCGIPM